jgi:hypothetical protein
MCYNESIGVWEPGEKQTHEDSFPQKPFLDILAQTEARLLANQSDRSKPSVPSISGLSTAAAVFANEIPSLPAVWSGPIEMQDHGRILTDHDVDDSMSNGALADNLESSRCLCHQDIESRASKTDVLNGLYEDINVANVLLNAGWLTTAYRLYSKIWKTIWNVEAGSVAPLVLVNVVSHLSQTAESAKQLAAVRTKIEMVTDLYRKGSAFSPSEKCVLHTCLAVVLDKLLLPSEAARHCKHAFWILDTWSSESPASWSDRRAPAFLLRRCATNGSQQLLEELEEDFCLEPWILSTMLKRESGSNGALRSLFAWCARELHVNPCRIPLDFMLEFDLAAEDFDKLLKRAHNASMFLFVQFWELFIHKTGPSKLEVEAWLTEFENQTRVSSPDVFASIALAFTKESTFKLMDAAQLYSDMPETSRPTITAKSRFINCLQQAASNLSSADVSDYRLSNAFFHAHAIVNVPHAMNFVIFTKFITDYWKKPYHSTSALINGRRRMALQRAL